MGKNGKCFTWCPKWIRLFKLSKALEKKTETLRKLEENSRDFRTTVSHKAPLQDIESLPSKEFTPSESSKEAFEKTMKALKDDNVNMIGLYGMGGVGKTTLVKEVGRRAKETQLFDEVLLATVSQNPNVMDIQDRMAESLGLHFDEETTEGRANRLWKRLETERKLLVILDDVWQDVDLEEIGIPFGADHRGCKVLLTTRLRGICFHMQCQQQVLLSILSENEAWALFKINAGLRDEDSNLNTVAKEVARECQGLPIALVTVGRALRDKSTVEWEVASKQLKNSQLQHMERNGEEKNTYACLKLSYDYLKHEKTMLCFLLCCLFPEEYNIPMEDLTRYAVGYGIHQDVESIEDARKQVYAEIKTLKDCCMLLGTETEEKVKMHDLVRDVAIQIASKEHGFMVKAGIGLKEWTRSNKSFEGCTTISLMGNQLTELPEGLVFPHLKVLLLELDSDLNVPARFFEGMKEIEVLSLEGGCLSLQSLEFSTNLQSLLLIHCKCKDDESEIIPDSLGFPKLKTLSIRCCDELEFVFPVSVSPCLLNLEEMEIVFCDNLKQIFYRGEGDALTRDGIINFPQLRKLSLSSCCFFGPKNFTAQLPSLQVLYIEEHEELGDLLAQFQGHTNLREIHITDCEGAQEIIQVGSFVTNKRTGQEFSLLSLKKLDLSFLPDMRCIWKGLVLSHLTILEVCYCQKLTHVFTSSMVASLGQLQFLAISACEELEQIIAKDNDDEKDQILSESDLQSLCFPNLCKVEIKGCNKLRSLFPVAMASGLPKLETLDVSHSSQLLGVFGQDDDASLVNVEKKMEFPNLSFLRLYNLPSIVCFSLGCDDFLFPCLEDSMVDECPKLTTKFPRKTNGSMSAPSEVLLIRLDFMPLF
ncbi:disease resistance protein [Salix suchowensis]|nr:disease resistance protein [Salix suchowensis]